MKSAKQILKEYLVGKTYMGRSYDESDQRCVGSKIKDVGIYMDSYKEDVMVNLEFEGNLGVELYTSEGIKLKEETS